MIRARTIIDLITFIVNTLPDIIINTQHISNYSTFNEMTNVSLFRKFFLLILISSFVFN